MPLEKEKSMIYEHPEYYRNKVLKNIKERRSIRTFLDKPVSEEDILTVLNAANQAPSAHNQQSWRFIIVSGAKKMELVDLIGEKARNFQRAASVLLRMAAGSIAGAPVTVAVVNTGELIERGKRLFQIDGDQSFDFFRTMEIQSSAAAVENLLLAATSLGLATVWLGILYLVKDDMLEMLGEPKGEFMAVIPMGYSDKHPKGPEKQPMNITVKKFN